MEERFPRPLTVQERGVLDHLLSIEFPGRTELLEQARTVEVVARWADEPTIELRVTASSAPMAAVENNPPVEASTPDRLYSVVLFVKEGRLNLLELVDAAGSGMANELPLPANLEPPDPLGPTPARSWWQEDLPDS